MNNDEHKILKTIGRILLLIILTATIAGVVCLVFNLLDELSAINKAAQTNQGKVGEMWASFSIRKEYFWTKPEQLEVSDLFFLSFVISLVIVTKTSKAATDGQQSESLTKTL